jgi:hypothetical protein
LSTGSWQNRSASAECVFQPLAASGFFNKFIGLKDESFIFTTFG